MRNPQLFVVDEVDVASTGGPNVKDELHPEFRYVTVAVRLRGFWKVLAHRRYLNIYVQRPNSGDEQ